MKIELEKNAHITGLENLKNVPSEISKKAVLMKVNDVLLDLSRELKNNDEVEYITTDSEEAIKVLYHSCAHLLAQAVLKLYPGTQIEYGPALDEGFFYDFEFPEGTAISEKDFPKIEKQMVKLAESNLKIERQVVTKEEAKEIFKDQKYKLSHIDEIEGELTVYRQGDYVDLCIGPHVPSTKFLKYVKLTAISGAYFKGDKNNPMLTRIYGTAQFSKEKLEEYLKLVEERKLSDHRKIGKDMKLFMLSDYGPGFPFWLPNGMILYNELEQWWYKIHAKNGYKFVKTPIILNKQLWLTSGHWANYKENMYTTTIDEEEYAIKPMNCPGGMIVYNNDIHSYKELPLRIGELGHVHRHEASGALNGLFRVRTFTQDDAHIFCTPDQLEDEISRLLKLFDDVYKVFDLPYKIVLSTRPEKKYIGEIADWNRNEDILRRCLERNNIEYKINEGDGAFYGPKLDFKIKDSLNRTWQCGTIQLDCNLPERFDLTYIDNDGEKKRPIMLHRAIFGSLERFIGVIIEHFKGSFPTWLAPKQVVIIPVNSDIDSQINYSKEIESLLNENEIRVSCDFRNEKMNYRIREAQVSKIPYQIIIGDNEVKNNQVSYRLFGHQETRTVSKGEFVKLITEDIKNKNTYRN